MLCEILKYHLFNDMCYIWKLSWNCDVFLGLRYLNIPVTKHLQVR